MTEFRPVRKLPPEVARKIAAGEVIDRPAAVVRELLDNSIDAGATKVSVEISGGGIERIRVTDNGRGMTADDLAICTETHTTSKISVEDDLLSLATLGFRGEALSSIRTVSDLEITTTRDGREAWKLELGKIHPDRLPAGTVVSIENLFGNFPARKQFLKRAASETLLCRQTFVEKALAWPGIEFRFSVDGVQKQTLPPEENLLARALAALEPRESETLFHEIAGSGQGFAFSAVLGSPDVVRADRKQLMVFVNGRRIMDFSLLQAIEYGCEGHFPNGGHPFGLLFVTMDPALVDFNIHPAKREARFRDSSALHHAVSSVIRDFFRRYAIASLKRDGAAGDGDLFPGMQGAPADRPLAERPFEDRPTQGRPPSGMFPQGSRPFAPAEYRSGDVSRLAEEAGERTACGEDFRYLGQVFGTFLAVEKNSLFYLIDQHAAHERILYDELVARSGDRQELLVPYRIETDSKAEDDYLRTVRDAVGRAGFTLENEGDGIWQITAVPVRWTGTRKDIAAELLETGREPEALVSHLYATAACRAACKAGDFLDPAAAKNLAARAFSLAEPVCPHGRPLWIMMDREELFARIKRT